MPVRKLIQRRYRLYPLKIPRVIVQIPGHHQIALAGKAQHIAVAQRIRPVQLRARV